MEGNGGAGCLIGDSTQPVANSMLFLGLSLKFSIEIRQTA